MISLYYRDEEDLFVEITNETPITTTHEGRKGDIKIIQLYLRNSDETMWYSNIRILPHGDVDLSGTGWGIKLSPETEELTSSEWDDIGYGDDIAMSNVGDDNGADTTTYFPFWYFITCPPNENAQTKTNIALLVSATENAVTIV